MFDCENMRLLKSKNKTIELRRWNKKLLFRRTQNPSKGPSIKTSAVKGVVQCEHFADKGVSSDADVRILWRKELKIFRNLRCVLTDMGD